MRTVLLVSVLVLGAPVLPHAGQAQSKRPAGFDDVLQVKVVASPVLSPDGTKVLYTVRGWEPASEREKDRLEARTRVWMVPADGSAPARQVTHGERGDTQPQWSPDGRYISFVSARGTASGENGAPKAQIYVMRADGGEGQKLTDAKEGVTSYAWSPDSTRIAYLTLDPRTEDEEAAFKRRDDERVFEGDFRYTHAWVIDVGTGGTGGERPSARRLTRGTEYTLSGLPSWAPDGKRFVIGAGATPMLRDNRRDVYIVDVEAATAERISTNFGSDGAPRWSPDGTTIAWTSQPYSGPPVADGTAPSVITQSRLMLYNVAAKTVRDVSSPSFDTDAGAPQWTAEGNRVVFLAGRRAYTEAFAYDLTAGRYTQLSSRRTLQASSHSKDGRAIVVAMDAPDAATEIYATDPRFSEFRKLTDTNPQIRELLLGETEVVTWKSTDGVEVEGVLLKPVGYEAGRRYPMLVVAHGGPAGAFVNNNRLGGLEGGQVWAGRGWAVFYPNPRGSTNYGEQFLRANIDDWGGGDYRDILSGVDALVARGIADPDRLAHIGWSYGGYMTAWVITQTTRFKAAMVGAGLTNMWSMYGTNDIPSTLIAYFSGHPNERTLPLYLAKSAMSHVDKVTTPTLILHGGSDERVPIGQAQELYRALKDRGKATELVFYPREGHGIQEYYHQKDRLNRIYDWVAKYTPGGAGTAR
ncbi:MAG: S9 family peptidase [Acidobacteria bacterium]|nr:S9 family peptidase [Acidobacteriota bacterium]